MVSIVEGVGGNDKGIVEDNYGLKSFTVKGTHNETGFGILRIHN